MKKINFFNTLALYLGGTYVHVGFNEVKHEHYRWILKFKGLVPKIEFRCKSVVCYKKDGKVIITEFMDNGSKRVVKMNYLEYHYTFRVSVHKDVKLINPIVATN